MAKITKDTLIVDCLKINPNSAEILQAVGMHCLGCAMAHGETIEQAVFARDNARTPYFQRKTQLTLHVPYRIMIVL